MCRFSALGNWLDGELNLAAGGGNGRLAVLVQIEELGRIVVPVADQPATESLLFRPLQAVIVDGETTATIPSVDLDRLPRTVVVLWSHYQSPRERCVETELDIRAVQEGRARGANVRSENSIVESSTGVVAVDVEVVVC